MADMKKRLRERLAALGYAVQGADEALLGFALDKAVGSIKNDCNLADLPEAWIWKRR